MTDYQAVGASWDATYTALAQAAGYPISLYSDRTGAVAVSGPDTVVGTLFDTAKSLTISSNLVANSTFSSWSSDNPVSWSIVGTETGTEYVTQSGSAARIYSSAGTLIGMQQSVMTVGAFYRVVVTVSALVSGAVVVDNNGYALGTISAVGTYTYNFRATNAYIILKRSSGATDATVSSVTISPISGNHVAAPTDAARPILRLDANHNWFLQFDGSDDALENSAASALNVGAAGNVTVLACVDSTVDVTSKSLVSMGKAGTSYNYQLALSTSRAAQFANTTSQYGGTYTTIGLPGVFGFKANGSGVIVRDGVTDKYSGVQVTASNTQYFFDVGASNSGTNITTRNYAGNVYGIITYLGDMSAAKYSRCYRWLWNKGGGVM